MCLSLGFSECLESCKMEPVELSMVLKAISYLINRVINYFEENEHLILNSCVV